MSIAEDLGPLTDLRDGLADGPTLRAVTAAAGDAQAELILQVGRRQTGGDGVLSNLRAGPVSAEVRQLGPGTAVVQMTPAGVWALMFGGARAHMIRGRYLVFDRPARSRSSRRSTRVRSGVIRHPGTRGSRALEAALPRAEQLAQRAVDDVIAEAVP